MRKSFSILFAGIVIAASVAWAQPAFERHIPPYAFPGMIARMGAPGMGPGERMVEVLTGFLDLTEKQQSAWKENRAQTEKAIEPMAKELQQIHESIRTKLEAGGAEPSEVGQLMIEAHSIETQIRAAEEASRDSFVASLMADQRGKLEIFDEIIKLMRPEPGPGAGPRPPQ